MSELIRITVGAGISPARPQKLRFADFDRRFGISPTPEHLLLLTVFLDRLLAEPASDDLAVFSGIGLRSRVIGFV